MPINFQISTNHATEFPAFSIKCFQSWNPFDWRSNGDIWEMFECEWPLGKMFGQWIKAEERGEEGGEAVVVIKLSLPTLPPPLQHLMIHNMLKSELGKVTKMQRYCQSIPILTRFFLLRASPILSTFWYRWIRKKAKRKDWFQTEHTLSLESCGFFLWVTHSGTSMTGSLRFYGFSTCKSSGGSEKVKRKGSRRGTCRPLRVWERVTNDDCSTSY